MTVIFLHGLGRSARSLNRLRKAVADGGYTTWACTYPSTQLELPAIADWLVERVTAEVEGPLMVVTHSMGGVVIRHVGDRLPIERIVMLAPPNAGSAVARGMANWSVYKRLYGPAGQGVGAGGWPDPPAPTGIVAGTGGVSWTNPPSWVIRLFNLLPREPHDGTVTVAETQGCAHIDFATVATGHSWLMNHPRTRTLVLQFLADGRFEAQPNEEQPNEEQPIENQPSEDRCVD